MRHDWPQIDNMLVSWRTRIYSLIPDGWHFIGPVRRETGEWEVAVRRPDGWTIGARDSDLQTAFMELGEELRRQALRTSGPN